MGGGGLWDFSVTPVPIGLGFLTGLGLVLGLGGLDLGLVLDNLNLTDVEFFSVNHIENFISLLI